MSEEPIHVLLVEDDGDHAELARRILQRQEPPFEVTVVGDGFTCLEALARQTYSAVLMDYSLPRMNGLEALERIWSHGHSVPIVMVTGQGDESVAVAAMKAGAADYIVKTGDYLATIPTVLRKVLKQHELALENARLYEEVQRRLRDTESLLTVGRAVGSTLEPTEILRRTTREMVRSLGADMGGAWLLTPNRHGLLPLAGYHVPKELVETFSRTPFPLEHPLAEEVSQLKGPIYSSHSQTDPRFEHPLAQLVPHKSALVVPISSKGEPFGGVGIAWVQEAHCFTPDELRLVEGIARQGAIALDNARLYAEAQRALAELKATQERLVKTERLRALGEMAAGVAHDFNNLLAVILGRSELLLGRAREPEVSQGLEAICRAARDGAQTVRRIQEFTRTRRTRPFGRVDLGELVQEVIGLNRPRWKDDAQSRGVRYDVRAEGGPVPPIAGIAGELREVFTNLLTNALEAMPAGGQVIFRLRSEAGSVVVTAEDTGCGMSEETRRRVFEPFFTTKGSRGTGLGLAVSWGIVTRHGGTIEIESTLGVGSAFTVRLLIAQEVPSEDDKPPPPPRPARQARVLVIEDEPDVRSVLRDLLAEEGYSVIEAGDGKEGLARCEAEPVALVLSDLSMPGMSGWEVAAACQERLPLVPVGLITGWGDQLDADDLGRHRIRFVVAKPFEPEEVLRQVAQALQGTHAV